MLHMLCRLSGTSAKLSCPRKHGPMTIKITSRPPCTWKSAETGTVRAEKRTSNAGRRVGTATGAIPGRFALQHRPVTGGAASATNTTLPGATSATAARQSVLTWSPTRASSRATGPVAPVPPTTTRLASAASSASFPGRPTPKTRRSSRQMTRRCVPCARTTDAPSCSGPVTTSVCARTAATRTRCVVVLCAARRCRERSVFLCRGCGKRPFLPISLVTPPPHVQTQGVPRRPGAQTPGYWV